MKKATSDEWIQRPWVSRVLVSFTVPRMPSQVERRLGIKKLKITPFVKKGLLKSLNPMARKGRLYIVTDKGRRLLGLPTSKNGTDKCWDVMGWIMASPKQRLVVLQVIDSAKRMSENIRARGSRLNSHLTRISCKGILKQLVTKGLVNSQMRETKRYYWLSGKGKSMTGTLDWVFRNQA
jgi:predicted transcriptional regulator